MSTRSDGSSAASRLSAVESLSSSDLVSASMATGSSGVGSDQGRSTRGSSTDESVSPVSARVSRPTEAMSPATTRLAGDRCCPNGCASEPSRSSSSWSSWPTSSPKNDVRCPETCTGRSASSEPENTRTRLTRPTYGSLAVLTTSASSGPSGSQVTGSVGLPSGV